MKGTRMTQKWLAGCGKGCAGQSMIEFAFIFPIFLLILLAVFDFGRLLFTKHLMDKAVREGARAGATEINPDKAVVTAESVCENVLSTGNLSDNCPANIVQVQGVDAVSVQANHTYEFFFSGEGMFSIAPPVNLTSTATMRKEG